MEEILAIFPQLGEQIMMQLSHQSLTKCKSINREMYEFLFNGRALWKQMILKFIPGNYELEIYINEKNTPGLFMFR